VALLWKMICNLGDPMSLRHPVLKRRRGCSVCCNDCGFTSVLMPHTRPHKTKKIHNKYRRFLRCVGWALWWHSRSKWVTNSGQGMPAALARKLIHTIRWFPRKKICWFEKQIADLVLWFTHTPKKKYWIYFWCIHTHTTTHSHAYMHIQYNCMLAHSHTYLSQTRIHTSMHTHTHNHAQPHTHTHTHIKHDHTLAHTSNTHTCTHTHAHLAHPRIRTLAHTSNTHTCVCMHARARLRAHTHTLSLSRTVSHAHTQLWGWMGGWTVFVCLCVCLCVCVCVCEREV